MVPAHRACSISYSFGLDELLRPALQAGKRCGNRRSAMPGTAHGELTGRGTGKPAVDDS